MGLYPIYHTDPRKCVFISIPFLLCGVCMVAAVSCPRFEIFVLDAWGTSECLASLFSSTTAALLLYRIG